MRKRGAGSFAVLTAVAIALLSGSAGIAHMPVVYAEENEVNISFDDINTLNSKLSEKQDGTPVNATLSGDISGAGSIQVNTGNVLTLDLNGNTLSGPSTMISVNGGSVVITGNGTLESTNNTGAGVGVIAVKNGGNLKISSGSVIGKICAVYIDGGTVEIEGGSFEAELSQDMVYTIYVNSGTLTANGGYISANGNSSIGAIYLGNGSVEITEGSSLSTTATGFGYTCYATSSGNLTISGGNFSLNAPGGKCLLIGSNVTANVTGGSYSGNSGSIGVDTGVDSSVPQIGGWANSFYDKFQGGVLSDNTFYKENNFVYTNPTVSVASGTWNGTCKETRNLTTGSSYAFSGEGWMVEGDSTVYGSGSFCVPADGDYTFSR